MQCPECEKYFKGNRCGCGYTIKTSADWTERPHVPCKFPACPENAILRIGPNGNVCRKHYDEYWQAEAQAYCEELGLTTTAQKRAYCKAKSDFKAPGKDWAYKIVEGYEKGENYSHRTYTLACEAIKRDVMAVEGETF